MTASNRGRWPARRVHAASMSLAFALLLAVAGACGGDNGNSADAPPSRATATTAVTLSAADVTLTLELEMRDIAFDTDALEFAAGEVVEIALTNRGSLTHDFTIERVPAEASLDGDRDVTSDRYDVHVVLDRRDAVQLLLRVDEAGEYVFFCSVPGHRGAGMEGLVTVH